MELDMEKILGTKTLTRGVWSVKTILGQFGLKAYGVHPHAPPCILLEGLSLQPIF